MRSASVSSDGGDVSPWFICTATNNSDYALYTILIPRVVSWETSPKFLQKFL